MGRNRKTESGHPDAPVAVGADGEAAPELADRASLKTFKGRGVQPGVDLDDNSSLLDAMKDDCPE